MQKLFTFLKPYLLWIMAAFGLLYLQAQCDLALPDYMAKIVSNGIAVSDTAYILKNGLIMLLISLAGVTLTVLVGLIASRVGSALAVDIRSGLFKQVSGFSNAEFDTFSVSSLITRSTNDITQIQLFVIMTIRMVFYAPIMGIGGIIKAVEKSGSMPEFIWILVFAIVTLLLLIGIILAVVQPRFVQIQKLIDKLNLVSREGLVGMMVVRAFGNEKHEEDRFEAVNRELTGKHLFVSRVMSLIMPCMMIIMFGVSIAVVWVASFSASDIADVGNMMAFMQYTMQIIMSFMMVSMVFILMPRAVVSAKRVGEVLGRDASVKDLPSAKEVGKLKGEIEFKDVSFQYQGGEDMALDHISFKADPGKVTAFIGSTGSGKTTVISLIPRLYDVTQGKVLIDGIDIQDMTLRSLRENIGFVPQKSVLFSGTIDSNIRYGQEDLGEEGVHRAAEIAQAKHFIEEKEQGFLDPIAQGGSNVSGGQKQRLSIARAIAKNCSIYIFDDSFSALDFKTDSLLRSALKEHISDATILIVAQRVGTIMNADQIIVLNEGKIVGIGTHKELLNSCPVYLDIARSQLSEEELKR